MNVGPAICILLVNRSYHQIAPHFSPLWSSSGDPMNSIGAVITTGKKMMKRCKNLIPVRMGEKIRLRIKLAILEMKLGSAGDAMTKAGLALLDGGIHEGESMTSCSCG
jgi:hypothetical protein